jgi:hypothetical protein
VDNEVIDLTGEITKVKKTKEVIVGKKLIKSLYNSDQVGPARDPTSKVKFLAPKSAMWIKSKRYQYGQMKAVMDTLSCEYDVEFRTKG